MPVLRSRQQCIVYLVTYSRADLSKVPTKQVFSDIVVKAFEHLDVTKVAHWVVAQENHHDKEIAGAFGTHYHVALKLTRRARWCRVCTRLESENGIKVNFSSAHATYYSAYKYVTKEDQNVLLSEGHPQLSGPPATEAATIAKKGKKKQARHGQEKKGNGTRRLMSSRSFAKTKSKVG
jgi:hypothetical protein